MEAGRKLLPGLLLLLMGCSHAPVAGEIWIPVGEASTVDVDGDILVTKDALPPHLLRNAQPAQPTELWVRRGASGPRMGRRR
jgi:hypothetical protein